MSDTQQGPDWWLGTDGKWYPPMARATDTAPSGTTASPPDAVARNDDLDDDDDRDDVDEVVDAAHRSIRSSILVLAALAVVIGGVAAWTVLGSSSSSHRLGGDFTLYDTAFPTKLGSTCTGSGGYSDIGLGTTVVVKDSQGKIVATGELGIGSVKVYRQCVFPVLVTDVPGSDFYAVEVSHRGSQTYSRAALEAAGWQVHLTLGSP